MKPLLLALAMASVLIATPSLADYKTCMDYCMTKHDFDHCHPTCSDQARSSGEETNTVRKPDKPCILTNDEKLDRIYWFLYEHYGSIMFMAAHTLDNDPDLL